MKVKVHIVVEKIVEVDGTADRERAVQAVRENWETVYRHRIATTDHDVRIGRLGALEAIEP